MTVTFINKTDPAMVKMITSEDLIKMLDSDKNWERKKQSQKTETKTNQKVKKKDK